jgi:hypothetical protein
MKNKLKYSLAILVLFALSLVIVPLSFSYLTHNSPVKANILVVEGWIADYGLQRAYTEFQDGDYDYLMITGNLFPDHITLYINSFLIFYPHQSVVDDENEKQHLFEMKIVSAIGEKDSAHFAFWVNDQRITEHYTTENRGLFQVTWEGRLSDIDSVMVQYTNDMVGEKGDRNLVIHKLNLNGQNLIIEHADLFLDRGRPFGRFRWNVTATSYAEMAAHFFVDWGVDRNKVIPVTNHHANLRRTYGNALSLKQWLEVNQMEIEGFNVVSMEYHSRRTWLTYNKLLDDFGKVGIISAENPSFEFSRRLKFKNGLLELIALIYYYLFILPWI